jgi:SecD/SecF fusion protein
MPGLAGILLTIGMSVDANILIFERYREERKKGKPLVQSLGAGYDRAFWVIFDSNLTTLITGYVLFYMGSPEVKGFAVTLISGIFASFFTAVFVTRIVLSILVNLGILKDVKMMEAFQTPRIEFVKHQKAFIGASVVILVLTWVVVMWRGMENYGIDFTGGARVTMNLTRPLKVEDMREKIAGLAAREPELFRDYSIQTVHSEAFGESRTFTVLTRAGSASGGAKVARAEEAKAQETGAAAPAPSGAVPTQAVPTEAVPAPSAPAEQPSADVPKAAPEAPKAEAPAPEPEKSAPTGAESPPAGTQGEPGKTEAPAIPPAVPSEGGAAVLPAGEGGEEAAPAPEAAQLVRVALEGMLKAEGLLVPPPFPDSTWKSAESGAAGSQYFEQEVNLFMVGVDLSPDRFKSEINAWLEKDPLLSRANRDPAATYKGIEVTSVELRGKPTADMPVTQYLVRTSAYQPPMDTAGRDRTLPTRKQVEDAVRGYFRQGAGPETLQISEPFPQVLTVGPRVASGLQTDALVALFISFVGIVFYLSLRFEFIYGLAGVLALFHDTMMAIGIMAVTDQFFSSVFPVKFNLTELAAILTIIGFSINDTIVLFDRIRENTEILAKKKYSLEDLVDISVNQTLSRTLWTSLTVLLVLVVTLAFGGESVRGFAYIFAVGTIAGVYSTVFIASPIVIWFHNRAMARRRAMAALSA